MRTRNPKGQIGRIILCLAGFLWVAGCFGPSAVDLDYGNSVRNNLAQSVLNPQAGLTNTPATGLNPTAAAYEKEVYDKGFKGEEKKPMEMKISQ